MKLLIIGTGYVGLSTAVGFAHFGHDVTCVDIDEQKILTLQSGVCTIFEDGMQEAMQKYRENLRFSTVEKLNFETYNVIFIAVGTPERKDGSANLSYVKSSVNWLISNIKTNTIVVIKSTVSIGTNDKLQAEFYKRMPQDIKVDIVSNPEFLSQGTALYDILYGARIVVGAETKQAENIMRELYKDFNQPIVITDRRSAEMVKYASNDFLALKISYINEIANLCENIGANIDDVALGMGLDPRIGDKFLKAGIGYGGSCFPKDTKALDWLGKNRAVELKTIRAAIEVNEAQRLRMIFKARKYYESFENLTIAVLGLAFKPGTDDLRDAPSIDIVGILLDEGAKIKAWDFCATENFRKTFRNVAITYCKTPEETVQNADLCLILTEWEQILTMDKSAFSKMKKQVIIDGRNCFSQNSFTGNSTVYESIGRPPIAEN